MNTLKLQTNLFSFVNLFSSAMTHAHRRATYGSVTQRITLHADELHHIATSYRQLRVISGHAWLIQAGRDITLVSGELVQLVPDRHGALLTTLGQQPVIFELQ